ncbi:protein bicaudal D homolog isoform X2 [Diachasma alloeum]|uniref:protein bicaudal D homolog isoform X2 n=1 Tax=Diachasma alloeum TaxID=454923 RepID=UPI0007381538|nr:protein bicaudal D homolog isoform X2 [Diachasma alloeum]
MDSLQRGTVTTNNSLYTPPTGDSPTDGCEVRLQARAETTPATRKRRMIEQPSSQTPKTPRQGFPDPDGDETNRETDLPESREDQALHDDVRLTKKPPMHPDVSGKRQVEVQTLNRRNDSARLRKTIQWLEDGARKLREDLADARSELHEERRASKILKREVEVAVREARCAEAAKHQKIINELKLRLAQSPSRAPDSAQLNSVKVEMLKEENHRREITIARKRLAEADETIRKLRSSSLDPGGTDMNKRRKLNAPDVQRMDNEMRRLREANKRLEEKLQIVTEAERVRTFELRVQHENYEAEICALKKAQRTDTIRMMRKLRESERGHQIRLGPPIEDKINRHRTTDSCKADYDVSEADRLREVAIEQQEIIEFLRQALKERERKLDQLSNKKRKEEFYKQWLELEPVAEVDDEEEHEEEDSALSSAPSSLSPQPGGHWQSTGVSRETYEGLLLEFEELQTKYLEAQQELSHAKTQVRDLEQALLQETRGSQNSRRVLSDKLKETEERESCLQAEISELREQNELLEFRVLELEETGGPRESPDTADSGIVSPEPIQLFKDQSTKQQRAIATVIPYNSYTQSLSPVPVQKPPLSLQESGIFEEDDDDQVEWATCGTQTETPSGDLLQEVQRLQELRERIQERAVKVPLESLETDDRLTSCKERIQDLEERLAIYEADEIARSQDQLVAKQREEDVLDENYKLTERVYWLENELRNLQDAGRNLADVGTMAGVINPQNFEELTDVSSTVALDIPASTPCGRIFYDALKEIDDSEICSPMRAQRKEWSGCSESVKRGPEADCNDCNRMRKDYNEQIQQLAASECSLRRRIVDLETREIAFAKTLQKVDATWTQLEFSYASNLRKSEQELEKKVLVAQRMLDRIGGLEETIRNHVCEGSFDGVDMKERKEGVEEGVQTDESMEIDEDSVKSGVHRSTQTEETECNEDLHTGDMIRNPSGQIIAELAREAREEDEVAVESSRAVSRIRVQPDATTANDLVKITDSDTDKKVRKSRIGRIERDGWVMRVRNTSKGSRSVKNIRAVVNGHRFVLYQEICV